VATKATKARRTALRVGAVRATALDGSPLELPATLGDGALLLLAFSPGHKDDAKAWAEAVSDELGSDVAWLALAVLPRKARLGSKVLLAGVRRAIKDPALHARVGVLFDDADAVARTLGADGTEQVCVLWADASATAATRPRWARTATTCASCATSAPRAHGWGSSTGRRSSR